MGHISTNFSGFPLTDIGHTTKTADITTNRDFYIAIACLRTLHRGKQCDLETYLIALLGIARKYRNEAHFSLGDFAEMLHDALVVPAIDAVTLVTKPNNANAAITDPYDRWERTILQQIADLREMRKAEKQTPPQAEKQALPHEVTPSTHLEIWRHTSVPEYLECAAAGTFGGWDIGDETDVQEVDWSTAQAFLHAGQRYE